MIKTRILKVRKKSSVATGKIICAAVLEDFSAIGFDNDPESVEIAKARVKYHEEKDKA